jgi:uncharacterized protein (TIGR03086 family)
VTRTIDAVSLLERASEGVAQVLQRVSPAQLGDPTPCTEWDVQALIDHLAGGPVYLLSALGVVAVATPADAATYAAVREQCLEALRRPGNSDVRCVSPLGFEWSVAEATAGTFMDQLIHTWDLATATGQDSTLDADLVQACIAMFLPDTPEQGRAAGLIGPAIPVPAGAPAQDRLLGAMGRRP